MARGRGKVFPRLTGKDRSAVVEEEGRSVELEREVGCWGRKIGRGVKIVRQEGER